jgi:hypothetical protein
MHNKSVYVETFFKNSITCNNDNNYNNYNNLHAGALIQQDPNLISIDGSITSELLLSAGKGGRSKLVNRKS